MLFQRKKSHDFGQGFYCASTSGLRTRQETGEVGRADPDEFEKLLGETLREIDLRELRGFKPLKDLLYRTPSSYVTGQREDPTEVVRVTPETTLESTEDTYSFDFSTHVISVSHGVLTQRVTYRRHESGQETTDWHVADAWGPHGGYVHTVRESILVVRRPNNHTYADENLFEVWYEYKKVPHKDEMVVTVVKATKVPVSVIREKFQEKYPRVARELIWELSSLSRQMLGELRSKAVSFESAVSKLDRLSGSVTE